MSIILVIIFSMSLVNKGATNTVTPVFVAPFMCLNFIDFMMATM